MPARLCLFAFWIFNASIVWPDDSKLSTAEQQLLKRVTTAADRARALSRVVDVGLQSGRLGLFVDFLEQSERSEDRTVAGELHEATGRPDRAWLAYEAALERSPVDPLAVLGLTRLAVRSGWIERAREIWAQGPRPSLHPGESWRLEVALLETTAARARRLETLDETIELAQRAACAEELGEYELAASLFVRANRPADALRMVLALGDINRARALANEANEIPLDLRLALSRLTGDDHYLLSALEGEPEAERFRRELAKSFGAAPAPKVSEDSAPESPTTPSVPAQTSETDRLVELAAELRASDSVERSDELVAALRTHRGNPSVKIALALLEAGETRAALREYARWQLNPRPDERSLAMTFARLAGRPDDSPDRILERCERQPDLVLVDKIRAALVETTPGSELEAQLLFHLARRESDVECLHRAQRIRGEAVVSLSRDNATLRRQLANVPDSFDLLSDLGIATPKREGLELEPHSFKPIGPHLNGRPIYRSFLEPNAHSTQECVLLDWGRLQEREPEELNRTAGTLDLDTHHRLEWGPRTYQIRRRDGTLLFEWSKPDEVGVVAIHNAHLPADVKQHLMGLEPPLDRRPPELEKFQNHLSRRERRAVKVLALRAINGNWLEYYDGGFWSLHGPVPLESNPLGISPLPENYKRRGDFWVRDTGATAPQAIVDTTLDVDLNSYEFFHRFGALRRPDRTDPSVSAATISRLLLRLPETFVDEVVALELGFGQETYRITASGYLLAYVWTGTPRWIIRLKPPLPGRNGFRSEPVWTESERGPHRAGPVGSPGRPWIWRFPEGLVVGAEDLMLLRDPFGPERSLEILTRRLKAPVRGLTLRQTATGLQWAAIIGDEIWVGLDDSVLAKREVAGAYDIARWSGGFAVLKFESQSRRLLRFDDQLKETGVLPLPPLPPVETDREGLRSLALSNVGDDLVLTATGVWVWRPEGWSGLIPAQPSPQVPYYWQAPLFVSAGDLYFGRPSGDVMVWRSR